jgi:hypothetical protein
LFNDLIAITEDCRAAGAQEQARAVSTGGRNSGRKQITLLETWKADRAKTQAVSHWLLTLAAWFDCKSGHMVDKVALEYIFSQ